MDLAETAATWLEAARKTGELSKRTTEGYAYCLGLLVRAGFHDVEELTRERLAPWLDSRRARGIHPATLNRNLAAICSFCSMLERRGQFQLERLWGIRRLRFRVPPRKPPFFLMREIVPAVENAALQVDRQLYLAVLIDIASGVRASELSHLHHEDLHLEEEKPFLVVARDARRDVKTYRSRTVPIRRREAERLLELGVGRGQGPIFPPEKHNATEPYLQENTLGRRLAIARAVVGPIGGKLDFLTLRHTFASWHVQGGVSIAKVARWLGNCVAICERHYAALAPGGDLDCERAPAA